MSKGVIMRMGMLLVWLMGWMITSLNAQTLEEERRWQALLDASGVSAVLAQTDLLIQQEITNLEKAPLGFTAQELETLQQALLNRLGPEQLQADIIARLQATLKPRQQQELQQLLQSPRAQFLQTLQTQLDDAVVRDAMRTYKVQVKENAPNQHRVELISALDASMQQSALEAELKVELRKQLLATVTQLKTRENFSEAMLDEQLSSYRRDLEDSISRNALYAYLYLFKRTPSPQLQALVDTYNQPTYEQFMALCQETVQASFRAAREQLLQDLRLAGK